MKQMKKQLTQLLTIQAPSGQEHKVVNYLKPILKNLTDKSWTDSYGNLLAEKKVGDGKGATIMLSAHMDSVRNIIKGRQVIEEGGVFRSTKGVLGADDRAGIAIILTVLRNVEKIGFNGTIKVAFSREEEIGCIGSGKISKEWYKDVNLAIVVDRRGNRDVVVGCGQAFCSNEVGNFFEECGQMLDANWKAVEGGISDAMTFSENGINSVNLSAGYYNEHTEKEIVHLEYMKDTVNLILQALALVNDFYHTFGEVPEENDWVEAWGYNYGYGKYSSASYTTPKNSSYDYSGSKWSNYKGWEDDVIFEGKDTFGNIQMLNFDGYVTISQGGEKGDEIIVDEDTFRKMADAYYRYIGDRDRLAQGIDELEEEFIRQHGWKHI